MSLGTFFFNQVRAIELNVMTAVFGNNPSAARREAQQILLHSAPGVQHISRHLLCSSLRIVAREDQHRHGAIGTRMRRLIARTVHVPALTQRLADPASRAGANTPQTTAECLRRMRLSPPVPGAVPAFAS